MHIRLQGWSEPRECGRLKCMSVIALLALAAVQTETELPKCDMKGAKSIPFCEGCSKFLELEKDWDEEKKNHAVCKKPPIEVEVCEKTVFECRTCKERVAKKGTCKKKECKKIELTEVVDRAEIWWMCKGSCGRANRLAKKCDETGCSAKGKALIRSCQKAGQWPHGKP